MIEPFLGGASGSVSSPMPVGGVSLGRGNPVTYLQGVFAVENVDSGVVGCSIYCHNTDTTAAT